MANDVEKISELSENDAAKVSGGSGYVFPNEDGPEFDSTFRFKVGDHVEYITGELFFGLKKFTDGGTVLHRSHDWNGIAVYKCSGIKSCPETDWIYWHKFE